LVRFKPELRDRMLETLGKQPPRITEEMTKFCAEFERVFGITPQSDDPARSFI
jgi:hypothetical protein